MHRALGILNSIDKKRISQGNRVYKQNFIQLAPHSVCPARHGYHFDITSRVQVAEYFHVENVLVLTAGNDQ